MKWHKCEYKHKKVNKKQKNIFIMFLITPNFVSIKTDSRKREKHDASDD